MSSQNIQLRALKNGNVALMSDRQFDGEVKRVEFYRDQKLLMLVYKDDAREGDLLHYELDEASVKKVEHASNVLIYSEGAGQTDPIAYYAFLVQVGY
tara:strand:+ start:1782 stop:2072 length:291 start_codon:yes stop_codon:yes gene_type:complete